VIDLLDVEARAKRRKAEARAAERRPRSSGGPT
jgi:hypothetical protein